MNLEFSSPYGCSKGSADQYLIDYHRIYGIKTIVFRHSSMYGGLQHPSYDQGWVSWFVLNAVKTIKNKKTGVIYESEEALKAANIPEEDVQRDVTVIMPALDLLAKTK